MARMRLPRKKLRNSSGGEFIVSQRVDRTRGMRYLALLEKRRAPHSRRAGTAAAFAERRGLPIPLLEKRRQRLPPSIADLTLSDSVNLSIDFHHATGELSAGITGVRRRCTLSFRIPPLLIEGPPVRDQEEPLGSRRPETGASRAPGLVVCGRTRRRYESKESSSLGSHGSRCARRHAGRRQI